MLIFFIFIGGLFLGSFLGAFTWRIERGISIAKGRSFCPSCKHTISWFDNIPLVSFLLLGGKCRNCHKRISLREPFIELLTGASFVGVFVSYPYILSNLPWLQPFGLIGLVFLMLLAFLSIGIIVTDIEEMIIPDEFVFTGLLVTFFVLLFSPSPDLWSRMFVSFASGSFFLFLNVITKGRGMGLGDVKFALVGGLLLGYPLVLLWLFMSFVLGAAVGSVLILFKKSSMQAKIAFGPFLVIGMWIAMLNGNNLLQYLTPHLF